MGFVSIPSKIIYGSKSFTNFYQWVGDDTGWNGGDHIFYINNQYVMTNGFVSFQLSGDNSLGTLTYANTQYGGEPCFSGSGWKLYYCPCLGKWILTQNAPWFGYVPKTQVTVSYYDDNYEYDYSGDLWWECASINTTPFGNNTAVGSFTFGIPSGTASEYDLTQYSSITYTLTGDISNQYWRHLAGVGPCGTYESNIWVGYPTWTYTLDNQTKYVVLYGISKWFNLQYLNIRYIDTEYLTTRWRGYIIPDFGRPNLDTAKGWYATTSEPEVGSNFTLKWYHWVWDDPEDHDEGGSIVQESSWTDSEGVVHPMPDKTVIWDSVRNDVNLPIARGNVLTVVDMVEAAIWR